MHTFTIFCKTFSKSCITLPWIFHFEESVFNVCSDVWQKIQWQIKRNKTAMTNFKYSSFLLAADGLSTFISGQISTKEEKSSFWSIYSEVSRFIWCHSCRYAVLTSSRKLLNRISQSRLTLDHLQFLKNIYKTYNSSFLLLEWKYYYYVTFCFLLQVQEERSACCSQTLLTFYGNPEVVPVFRHATLTWSLRVVIACIWISGN